jgi:curved DNA-binding protein CbpA
MTNETIEVATDPWEILDISKEADESEIREAYLRCVKDHPPSREPALAERFRAAYDQLKDPLRRVERAVLHADPEAPLTSLLKGHTSHRAFVGSKLWLNVLNNE